MSELRSKFATFVDTFVSSKKRAANGRDEIPPVFRLHLVRILTLADIKAGNLSLSVESVCERNKPGTLLPSRQSADNRASCA